MAHKSQHKTPRIEVGGKGLSGAAPEDIERRARELALIDNRTAVTEQDRQRARDEFFHKDLPAGVNEDAESMQSMSRDPSDPMVDRGRQAPAYGDDEKAALERLALEGVEEAQHEQMVESRNHVDEPLRSRPKKKK